MEQLLACILLSEKWHSMEDYTTLIPSDTHDGSFYRAVLALHQDLFSLAQQVGPDVYSADYQELFFPEHYSSFFFFFTVY